MDKQEISSDIENTLRRAIHSADMHQYLQKQYKWDDTTIDNIDWLIHGNSIEQLTNTHRKTITRFLHDWLPVNGHADQIRFPTNCAHVVAFIPKHKASS
jgi:hypothetical protein